MEAVIYQNVLWLQISVHYLLLMKNDWLTPKKGWVMKNEK